MVDIYLRKRSNTPENHRNRVFASSRYGLNQISSKNVSFRQSYRFFQKGFFSNTFLGIPLKWVLSLTRPFMCFLAFTFTSILFSELHCETVSVVVNSLFSRFFKELWMVAVRGWFSFGRYRYMHLSPGFVIFCSIGEFYPNYNSIKFQQLNCCESMVNFQTEQVCECSKLQHIWNGKLLHQDRWCCFGNAFSIISQSCALCRIWGKSIFRQSVVISIRRCEKFRVKHWVWMKPRGTLMCFPQLLC